MDQETLCWRAAHLAWADCRSRVLGHIQSPTHWCRCCFSLLQTHIKKTYIIAYFEIHLVSVWHKVVNELCTDWTYPPQGSLSYCLSCPFFFSLAHISNLFFSICSFPSFLYIHNAFLPPLAICFQHHVFYYAKPIYFTPFFFLFTLISFSTENTLDLMHKITFDVHLLI